MPTWPEPSASRGACQPRLSPKKTLELPTSFGYALAGSSAWRAPALTADTILMTDAAVVHRGWLLKRSGLLKSWQRRYFALVVQSGVPCLVYGPGPTAPWAGSLPLGGATCGPLSRGEGHPDAACFYIHRDGATYVLGAASEAECLQWCTSITDQLRQANTPSTPSRALHTGGSSYALPVVWSPAERRQQQQQQERTESHEAALRDALHAAEEQRVRAERSCMAAEDDRAALCQQLLEARAEAARWEATARRLVTRMAASEQARCAVEHQRDLLLLQARGAAAGLSERVFGHAGLEEARPSEALLDDPADMQGWGLPLSPLANVE